MSYYHPHGHSGISIYVPAPLTNDYVKHCSADKPIIIPEFVKKDEMDEEKKDDKIDLFSSLVIGYWNAKDTPKKS